MSDLIQYRLVGPAVVAAGLLCIAGTSMAADSDPIGSVLETPAPVLSVPTTPGSDGTGKLVTEPTVVYTNLQEGSELNSAIATTDLTPTFGDDLELTDTGLLSELSVTLTNLATNGGTVDTLDAQVQVYTYATPTSDPVLAASLQESFDFTSGGTEGGLAPNTPGVLTFDDLEGEGAIIDSTDAVILVSYSNITGGTDRLGAISLSPIGTGDAVPYLYIDADDVGEAGFYEIVDANQDPVNFFFPFEVTVTAIPEPAMAGLLGLAGLGALRRRRA